MTVSVEYETDRKLEVENAEDLIRLAALACLEQEGCPYEAEINVLITDNPSIQEINRENRGIDAPTDVLSFPMMEFESPADFSQVEEDSFDAYNPETGEILLGDIVLSVDKIYSQAAEYGHSRRRELAFLVVHSMLHLMGYDHMEEEERKVMEQKQEEILEKLSIPRQ